jgi:hypothetical protein
MPPFSIRDGSTSTLPLTTLENTVAPQPLLKIYLRDSSMKKTTSKIARGGCVKRTNPKNGFFEAILFTKLSLIQTHFSKTIP